MRLILGNVKQAHTKPTVWFAFADFFFKKRAGGVLSKMKLYSSTSCFLHSVSLYPNNVWMKIRRNSRTSYGNWGWWLKVPSQGYHHFPNKTPWGKRFLLADNVASLSSQPNMAEVNNLKSNDTTLSALCFLVFCTLVAERSGKIIVLKENPAPTMM